MSKVRCKHCGDIIESLYRHDYNVCSCKKTFIDGGNDYIRTTLDAEVILNESF